MRWKTRLPIYKYEGQRRICSAFLFFPKTIGFETRWLEKASWWETYHKWSRFGSEVIGLKQEDGYWKATAWQDPIDSNEVPF